MYVYFSAKDPTPIELTRFTFTDPSNLEICSEQNDFTGIEFFSLVINFGSNDESEVNYIGKIVDGNSSCVDFTLSPENYTALFTDEHEYEFYAYPSPDTDAIFHGSAHFAIPEGEWENFFVGI